MVSSLEVNGGDLMDQCSWHDTPPALSVNLTDQLGPALDIEIESQARKELTSQQLRAGRGPPW